MQLHGKWMLAVLVGSSFTCALVARADTAAQARKAIQAVYAKRNVAATKKDINGVMAAYDPNFVLVLQDGQKGDLKKLKSRIAPYLLMVKTLKITSTIQNITVKGNDATLTVKEHLDASAQLSDKQGAPPNKVVADEVVTDTWKKTAKGWVQTKSVVKSETILMDGKPITEKVDLDK